jgi:hypothetical protein
MSGVDPADDRPLLRVTDLLTAPVRADGGSVGSVADLVVGGGGSAPVVCAVLVKRGRRLVRVGWDEVPRWGGGGIELVGGAPVVDPDPERLAESELLVRRDVLDVQVVDLRGHRTARVGDVLMAERDDGRLALVAVDVGLGAVIRRLGWGRLGGHFPAELVRWDALHLTSRRGHALQVTTPEAPIHQLPPEELALLLENLSTTHARDVLRTVSSERVADTLAAVHPRVGRRVLAALDEDVAAGALASLPPEHRHRWQRVMEDMTVPRRRYRRHRPRRPRRDRPRT